MEDDFRLMVRDRSSQSFAIANVAAEIVMPSPTRAAANRLGLVGGSSANPATLTPNRVSQSDSQLPLKPV